MIHARIVRRLAPWVCGCLLWGALPAAAQEPSPEPAEEPGPSPVEYPPIGHPAPTRVMFQSLVLPGWGQVSNASYFKAILFAGAYAGFLQWGIRLNGDKHDAEARLAESSEEDRVALQAEVDRLGNSRNSKFYYAGLTAVLAMADAFVDAHLKNFDKRMDSDIAWTPDGIQVGLSWSLSGSGR